MTWPMAQFDEAIIDITRGNQKVLQRDYLAEGAIPIIDQGQSLVGGYTDNLEFLHQSHGPVIVFGDHTKVFKYVDFPFAMGADGVKVLKVQNGWDSVFVYHFLRSVQFPALGYSRHFKILKEKTIPRPPIDEQHRIAALLNHADDLYAKGLQMLSLSDELAKSLRSRAFRGEL